jgi:hypothetical protein
VQEVGQCRIDVQQHPATSPTRRHHELRALRGLAVDTGTVGPDDRAVATVTALHDELNSVKVQVLVLFKQRLDGNIAQGLRLPCGVALPHENRYATGLSGPRDRRRRRRPQQRWLQMDGHEEPDERHFPVQ